MTTATPAPTSKAPAPKGTRSAGTDYAAVVLKHLASPHLGAGNAAAAKVLEAAPTPGTAARLAWLRAYARFHLPPVATAAAVASTTTTTTTTASAIADAAAELEDVAHFYPAHTIDPTTTTQIDAWLDWAAGLAEAKDYPTLSAHWTLLNQHLGLRSLLVGHRLTLADVVVWGTLKGNPMFCKNLKDAILPAQWPHLSRWFVHVDSQPVVVEALAAAAASSGKAGNSATATTKSAAKATTDATQAANLSIPLPHAEMGKVVTRFPPEPSGYLHIGHAKAALMNNYFARKYHGKLIIRFDDTNPSKEKEEYEQSIQEDLALIDIQGDVVSHTSDHFDHIYEQAIRLIQAGKAYVDDTPLEQMRAERFDGIPSRRRETEMEENLRKFEEMRQGTEYGMTCCLRAKIDMTNPNKAMRDPVIYRTNPLPHHRTGDRFKIYPTYDFACPIVDAREGVTHALRSNEYHDRNPLYQWMLDSLGLRQVHIWDFSRLNFIYTLLSKRKLLWFVEQGHVTGWDDPRFPTIRGIRRRGMTIQALSEYIISQGASQKEISLEWDKIWSINKRIIDPIVPRHTAIAGAVPVIVRGADAEVPGPLVRDMPKHKKNPDVGTKRTVFSHSLLVEAEDAKTFTVGQEVTFMDWGNMIVEEITKDTGGAITGLHVRYRPNGDFKKTVKVTWLSAPTPTLGLDPVPLTLLDYDYLISKKRLEEGDELEDFVTPVTEFRVQAVGDANLKHLRKGDMLQLERKGYYICDAPYGSPEAKEGIRLISIPDGRASGIGSKAGITAATAAAAAPAPASPKSGGKGKGPAATSKATKPVMYAVAPHYGNKVFMDTSNVKMYAVDSFYGKEENLAQASAAAPAPAAAAATLPKDKKATKAVKAPAAAAAAVDAASPLSKLDIVVGKVLEVSKHPDADSLYVEKIDVGEAEPRTVVSGLVKFMQPEDIQGKTILVLKNLKPVAMRGVKSFAMVLCASNADHTVVEFLVPPAGSMPGDRVFFAGHTGEPEAVLNPKKKVWETVQPGFTTTPDLVAVWNGVPFETAKGVVKTATLVGASIK